MPKNVRNIRRCPIDRVFIGTHSEKIEGREAWFEAGHVIKGASYSLNHVTEETGSKQLVAGVGFLIDGSGEMAQNTWDDLAFYRQVMNGVRNIGFLTGSGDEVMILRLFRLRYGGGGAWYDNRISIVTDEKYDSSMDKAAFKLAGFIRSYETYQVKNVSIAESGSALVTFTGYPSGRLQFDIIKGAIPAEDSAANPIGS